MARHRAVSDCPRWRRSPAPAVVRAQRLLSIELVDALTGMVHRVSPDELLVGRARGAYQSLCGARFLAASMVDPGRGPCRRCREQATS
jgi:hypothetical protein